jgi:hypothetical protein
VFNDYRAMAKKGVAYTGAPLKGKVVGFANALSALPFCVLVENGIKKQLTLAGCDLAQGWISLDNLYSPAVALKNLDAMLSRRPSGGHEQLHGRGLGRPRHGQADPGEVGRLGERGPGRDHEGAVRKRTHHAPDRNRKGPGGPPRGRADPLMPEYYGECVGPDVAALLTGNPVPPTVFVQNEVITRANIDRWFPKP